MLRAQDAPKPAPGEVAGVDLADRKAVERALKTARGLRDTSDGELAAAFTAKVEALDGQLKILALRQEYRSAELTVTEGQIRVLERELGREAGRLETIDSERDVRARLPAAGSPEELRRAIDVQFGGPLEQARAGRDASQANLTRYEIELSEVSQGLAKAKSNRDQGRPRLEILLSSPEDLEADDRTAGSAGRARLAHPHGAGGDIARGRARHGYGDGQDAG